MEKNNTSILYINMIVGGLGLILIIVGDLRNFVAVGSTNYPISFLGFILTMIYINYLEDRAGINKKIVWVRAILSILIILFIFYLLF